MNRKSVEQIFWKNKKIRESTEKYKIWKRVYSIYRVYPLVRDICSFVFCNDPGSDLWRNKQKNSNIR